MLSRSDADYLRRHFPEATSKAGGAGPLHVLLPALRSDMAALPPPAEEAEEGKAAPRAAPAQRQAHAATAAAGAAGAGGADAQQAGPLAAAAAAPGRRWHARHYLACCVRLSPEKEPHRFVDLVLELQASWFVFSLRTHCTKGFQRVGKPRGGPQF